MKKLLFVLAAMMLIPLAALAGMTAISDSELQDVEGQTGITISMTMTVTMSTQAWEDSDGFSGCTTMGAVVMTNVVMPTIALSNVNIDAGTCGTLSYLSIDTGNANIISGDTTIGDLVIGTSASATTASLGKFVTTGLGISFGNIKIRGH